MKIVVLNGSPKGNNSVTMQYVEYLRKKFPQHDWVQFNVAQQIKRLETDEAALRETLDAVANCSAVLWAFPLYVLLVHAHYKRFIELVAERGATGAFQGKYTAILSTSIQFYDHTAHNYIHGICDDWGMKYSGGFSAHMHDLFRSDGRQKLRCFTEDFLDAVERSAPTIRDYPPVVPVTAEYRPDNTGEALDTAGKKIVIVTDDDESSPNLRRMTQQFAAVYGGAAETINLRDIDIKGSCLGCIRCGYDNTCIYSGKDGFVDFFNQKIRPADILVFAGQIHDRYLSSLWKTYFDRAFFNTHIPALMGKQLVWLISGPLTQLPNLRQILEAYTQVQRANLTGIVTDEAAESGQLDAVILETARRSLRFAHTGYVQPATFLGVGAHKIFRDEIWGPLRFPFVADDQFYRRHGFYDFPQKDYLSRLQNWGMRLLIAVPAIRRKIYSPMMMGKVTESYQKKLARICAEESGQ